MTTILVSLAVAAALLYAGIRFALKAFLYAQIQRMS